VKGRGKGGRKGEREEGENGVKEWGEEGGRGMRMGIAHPLVSAQKLHWMTEYSVGWIRHSGSPERGW